MRSAPCQRSREDELEGDKMDGILFWTIFFVQFIWWFFLSLTRIGKIITGVWPGMVILLWYLNVYFNYFPLASSGDINLWITAIKSTILSGVNLILLLVIPPWVGLIAGAGFKQIMTTDGGIINEWR
jgi:hypothetical protein